MPQINSLALASYLWLDDEGWPLVFKSCSILKFAQSKDVLWEDKGEREKSIGVGKSSLHSLYISSELCFSGKVGHAREMINLLVRLHVGQEIDRNGRISPHYVLLESYPLMRNLVAEFSTNLFDYRVTGVGHVDYDSVLGLTMTFDTSRQKRWLGFGILGLSFHHRVVRFIGKQ